MHGDFKLFPNTGDEVVLHNFIPSEGGQTLLRMILWDDHSVVVGGGNFYIGLMGAAVDFTTTLATLAGEPAGNGYARQAVLRSNAGWPTETQNNNVWHTQSQTVTFTASGPYNVTVQRVFICSVLSGTVGKLIAISAPFPTPFQVDVSTPLPVAYDFRQD